MLDLFMQYILPFLMGILLVGAVALRIHWNGGPALLFIAFFLLAFGPSLLYALIADDSSGVLFGISTVVALVVTGLLALCFYRKGR